MTLLSTWLVGGLFLDGWAHTHDKVDQSFFTPWHAILYSGWMAVALFLAIHALAGRSRGQSWQGALPLGYFLSLVGAVGFGAGGLADMGWHLAFGIERGIEALISPSHMLLAVSMGLIDSGPFRARLHNPNANMVHQLPAIWSLALMLSVVAFFTQATHPVAQMWGMRYAHGYQDDDFAATALLLGGVTFAAATLFALRLGQPMPGAFMLIFGLSAFGMGFLNGRIYPTIAVWAFVAGGLVLDGVCAALRRAQPATRASVMAALTPVVLLGAYFAAIHFLFGGLSWRIHFWLGMLTMTAMGGLLLSKLTNRATPSLSP
ncbi:MAG: hypothetical protein HC853_19235 [Anaerolineae bacterium]|nr:hypothetical protein [Anaerolineae bacterium]